jgi:hypothetical protein
MPPRVGGLSGAAHQKPYLPSGSLRDAKREPKAVPVPAKPREMEQTSNQAFAITGGVGPSPLLLKDA